MDNKGYETDVDNEAISNIDDEKTSENIKTKKSISFNEKIQELKQNDDDQNNSSSKFEENDVSSNSEKKHVHLNAIKEKEENEDRMDEFEEDVKHHELFASVLDKVRQAYFAGGKNKKSESSEAHDDEKDYEGINIEAVNNKQDFLEENDQENRNSVIESENDDIDDDEDQENIEKFNSMRNKSLAAVFERLRDAAAKAKEDIKAVTDIEELKRRDIIYSPSELVFKKHIVLIFLEYYS